MPMPRLLACALLMLGTASAGAASLPAVDDLRIAHETFTLPNGLTVVVHEDHAIPVVSVNVWYHVGSQNERRGRTGFAHLFEHFFFNGSEHHPHGFREAMDDLGATNRNGTTNTDRTNFFEDVPVSALERTLYLEADRMGWLSGNLSEAMLERERGVVKNEKRQGENRPYGQVWNRIVETIYPYSHPYSWSTIGSMEDLDAARMDDIRDWYDSWYGPHNAVLALAGDITVERARELAERYFGPIKPGKPVARLDTWVPVLDRDIRDVMQDRVPQARVHRVWHLPPWGDAQTHALELFAGVLAGSDSALLNRRLVFERQLATDVGAFVWTKELGSNLVVMATAKPGVDPAELERELDAVIGAALADGGVDAAALDRAKAREFADFARGLERLGSFSGRAAVLAESATYGGDADAYLQRLQNLRDATPASVTTAARQWLQRHHYTLTVNPYPTLAATSETIDRSELPALGTPPDVRFPELQRAELGNGLQLILLERHSAPLVNAALLVNAGNAADPADAPGIGRLALDLLDKGSRQQDAFAIADRRDLLGATFWSSNSLDLSTFSMQALRANLDESLQLYAEVIREPAFPPDMVEIQRKQQLAGIAQEQADPFGSAWRITPRLLYGEGHPYAAPASGRGYVDAVEAIAVDDLRAWHQRWFRPNNATLVVAGDVTMEQLRPLVERHFGDWPAADVPTREIATTTSPGRGRLHLVDRPGAAQSVIIAAHLTEPAGSDDDLAIETVIRNFGGIATSRLNRNLRLDKHWSYGSSGFITTARGPRSFMVVAPVQSDRTLDAMREVRQEILDVAGARPVVGEEFDSIQRNQLSALAGRFATLDSLINAASELVTTGRSPEYWYGYAGNMRELTPDDLARAAKRFIRPGELTWVVIGDLALIEPALRDAGFGEIVRLDANGGAPVAGE